MNPETDSSSQIDPDPDVNDSADAPTDGSVEPVSPVNTQPETPPLATGPVRGFLTIEERSGKRVLDAWFVSESDVADETSQGTPAINDSAGDVCQPVVAADPQSSFLNTRSRAVEAIELVSRSGLHARLDFFLSSDTVVYATEERWLREPMPDDTQVNLVGNPRFDAIASPMLSAVQQLELLQPRRPILASTSTPLQWNPSDHPDDQIVLTVWPRSRTEVSGELPTFTCTLADDGRFALTDAIPDSAALSNNVYAFRMRRERRIDNQVDGMRWSIVQTSLATF